MKKQIRLIICLMLCTAVILSVCMIEHNFEHNCLGEDCHICHDIALQRQILKLLFLCVMCGGAVVSASFFTALISLFADTEKRRLNLVANKIKLTA